MYLLYVDDAGSAANKNEAYFVLGGISVFERQAFWLAKELDDLAAKFSPSDPASVEFHASEIFSRRTPPWHGMSKEQARGVILDVLGVLAQARGSTACFACAVHKASFPGRDPVEIAFEEMCRRFDLQLSRFHAAGDTQRGLLIFDQSAYQTEMRRMAREFRSLGTRWGVIRNLAETPLFIESHASRLVQLADHVAYAVFRRYNALDATYLDPILSRFDSENGRLHGLMHRHNLGGECHCPACMSRRLTRPGQTPSPAEPSG